MKIEELVSKIFNQENVAMIATHTDGDGFILIKPDYCNGDYHFTVMMNKDQAMNLLAQLAVAVRDEYGSEENYNKNHSSKI